MREFYWHLGIINYFQKYKAINLGTSMLPPKDYAERFVRFFENIIKSKGGRSGRYTK